MSFLNIKQVAALPGTLEPTTLYFVKSAEAGLMDVYLTDSTGTQARHSVTKGEVQTEINNAITNFNNMRVVADIAARDALAPNRVTIAYVVDASADTSVDAGAASYMYDPVATTWNKIHEYESLDVKLVWTSIEGRPASSAAAIDDAVAKAHTHANKAVLDKLGEDAEGNLMYNGKYPKPAIEGSWA